jgi:LmbE family N-acetylglucosaminyl deacetylase
MRAQELEESAKILGAKEVFFLGYEDGTLCNNIYHTLAEKIEEILNKLKPDTIITYEPRGVSGHIDHITIAMVSCYVFHKLPFIKQIWQYCISRENRDAMPEYYIYFPQGYKKEDIDKTVDVSTVWHLKEKSMRAHASQMHDIERVLTIKENLPKEEYFLVHTK